MCGGVAIRWQTIPESLRKQYGLAATKVGKEERVIRFDFNQPVPALPVEKNGELKIFLWGNRDDVSSRLPRTGWCRTESLSVGKWEHLFPEEVTILAFLGREKKAWFTIDGGIRGVTVLDEQERPHVYMLTQEGSQEYRMYTNHERMPVFIGDWAPLKQVKQT